MTAKTLKVALSSIFLDKNKNTMRIPPRKIEDRQSNYDELFDYNTLFSDIFFLNDGGVELLGPPLLNLEKFFRFSFFRKKAKIKINGFDCEFNIINNKRKTRILISEIPENSSQLTLEYEGGVFSRNIQPNNCEFFQGHNVLVTQSRDNPLEWIGYWVAHHVKHHEIDAVLIYDNGSVLYSVEKLEAFLCSIPGLEKVCVVDWRIPFGVAGNNNVYDSDFGQHQAWDNAMLRFCSTANCVIFGDIDELILHEDGYSISRIIKEIDEPVIAYKRRQIEGVLSSSKYSMLPRMHCHTHLYSQKRRLAIEKYAVNPAKINFRNYKVNFRIHDVAGCNINYNSKIIGRHFDSLKLHWRNGDFNPIPFVNKNSYNEELIEDELLKESFRNIDLSFLKYLEK